MLNDNIKKIISPDINCKTLYIGIGNSLRSDDGVGQYIINNLNFIKSGNINIINAANKIENYIEEITRFLPDKIIFFDAANFCSIPGTINLIPENNIEKTTLSTHTFPLPVITSLIKNEIKADIYFIGIQIKDISLGENISKEIKESADKIIKYISGFYNQMDYNKNNYINLKL